MPPASNTKTRKDVAWRVAESMGEPVYKADPWVRSVLYALRDMMMEADPEVRIELREFGVFEVKKTRPRSKARNPRTNETVFIPARRKTRFRPGKRLREALQVPLSPSDGAASGEAAHASSDSSDSGASSNSSAAGDSGAANPS